MIPTQVDEKAIFNAARMLIAPDARRAYLDQASGDNASLRARIEALLRVYEEDSPFLQSPVDELQIIAATTFESTGTVIGNYKLLEPIGEGGFGVVFWRNSSIQSTAKSHSKSLSREWTRAGLSPASRPSDRRWP